MREEYAEELVSLLVQRLIEGNRGMGAEMIQRTGLRDVLDDVPADRRTPSKRVADALAVFRSMYLDPLFMEDAVAREFAKDDLQVGIVPDEDRLTADSQVDFEGFSLESKNLAKLRTLWLELNELIEAEDKDSDE